MYFTYTVNLSTQECKWVSSELSGKPDKMMGRGGRVIGNGQASHQGGRGRGAILLVMGGRINFQVRLSWSCLLYNQYHTLSFILIRRKHEF